MYLSDMVLVCLFHFHSNIPWDNPLPSDWTIHLGSSSLRNTTRWSMSYSTDCSIPRLDKEYTRCERSGGRWWNMFPLGISLAHLYPPDNSDQQDIHRHQDPALACQFLHLVGSRTCELSGNMLQVLTSGNITEMHNFLNVLNPLVINT